MSLAFGPTRTIADDATAHGLFRARAVARPEAPALRVAGRDIGYGDLLARAETVAATLADAGVGPGDFVPVLTRPGADCVAAALGVLFAGAAFAAVDPAWPAERLAGILDDLGAELILDTGASPAVADLPGDAPVRRLRLPDRSGAAMDAPPTVGADSPACVFFTSGSTGRPKGVVVPHRALIRTFVDGGYADFGPDTVMPLVAAPYWDAGALEMFGPLLNGGCAVEPRTGLLTPAELRRLVREDRVTTMWLTSSLVNLVVDEDPEAFAGLRHLLTGGERLSPSRMASLLAHHPTLRLTNGYGPVESMVFVSTHDIEPADTDDPRGIPVGRAVGNTLLAVCAPDGTLAATGSVGELWVGGDGLALGYLNRPREDADRFGKLELPDGRMVRVYRTGDAVAMSTDGRLSYVGRADRQFKLRGYRIEPGEIERQLTGIPGVRHAFAVPLRDADGSVVSLAVACVVTEPNDRTPEWLAARAARALPAHLRPDRYLLLDQVPLGPTGKADLRAVERLLLAPDDATTAAGPADTVTQGAPVSPALAAVREITVQPGLRGDQNLLATGVNSLQVLRIAARLTRLLGAELAPRDVYEADDTDALERLAAERRAAAALAGPGPDPRPQAPTGSRSGGGGEQSEQLTAGEKRFWLAERLAPGAAAHVAVSRVEIAGSADPARVAAALTEVASAHPALRTTFPTERGRPRRAVAAVGTGPRVVHRFLGAGPETLPSALDALTAELADAVHDLAGGPLLAAGLLTQDAQRHHLVLAVHHAVYDGHSEQVLLADLAAALDGRALAPAPAPKDAPVSEVDLAFWRAEAARCRPLAWPGGRGVPLRDLWTAGLVEQPLHLAPGTAARVTALAARLRRPALAVHLAVWSQVVAEWSGADDFAVGTVVAARSSEQRRTVGYFANSLPVRVSSVERPGSGAAGDAELVTVVGSRLLDVLAHSAVPTDRIAALGPRPEGGRMPLFQTMLVLQRVNPALSAGDVVLRPRPAPPLGPQAELCCELWEDGDRLTGSLHAPRGFLPDGTLSVLAERFTRRLDSLLTAPTAPTSSHDKDRKDPR